MSWDSLFNHQKALRLIPLYENLTRQLFEGLDLEDVGSLLPPGFKPKGPPKTTTATTTTTQAPVPSTTSGQKVNGTEKPEKAAPSSVSHQN